MPHITLEYSNNIKEMVDFTQLFEKLHFILHETAKVNIDNCKSRTIAVENVVIGTGEKQEAFVHLNIRWLEGRSKSLKNEIGNLCLKLLKKEYQKILETLKLQITIEIQDISKDTYFKHPKGTFSSN